MINSSLIQEAGSVAFIQGVGIIAFVIGATAFLHQDDRKFRLHLMLFQIILCSHFILMGAMTAAFGCGISALRSYVSTKTDSSTMMWLFITLLWLTGAPSAHHAYELLTLFGASVATWGLFKAQGIQLKLMILFNSFCWLTHNLLLGSIGATLMEMTFIGMNLFSIARMLRARKSLEAERS
ncbi:YgjV family protein [Photobacterium atrarenae]|uniref:YgjV family protein n=1 Tax=Photobacterium atrarenae TaxID=865757 RepID=A0ABY5GPI5_9GAMM|nr:YgjV family protein [Photobacterium atrarenae]UTV31005.1 YgjV family protein [Photobacterium atrarenae]